MAPVNSDNWRPTASLAALKIRAQILARIRSHFAQRDVLEVETPLLSRAGTTDPNLHSFMTRSLAPGDNASPLYLHTSPEFAMKRLLAAGSGSIFQICKVFRAGESGRRHNPEFTMLEWYRVGFGLDQMMQEVETLAIEVIGETFAAQPSERITYRDAFRRYANVDPYTASTDGLIECAKHHDIAISSLAHDDVDGWQNLILTHVVEPHLGRGSRLTFLYDYPGSQAALARVRPGSPPIAERFELYINGIELANGFHELADSAEQRRRFNSDQETRRKLGLAAIPPDEHLLEALQHEFPNCSGVALGLDRLIMLAINAASVAETMTFPADRA